MRPGAPAEAGRFAVRGIEAGTHDEMASQKKRMQEVAHVELLRELLPFDASLKHFEDCAPEYPGPDVEIDRGPGFRPRRIGVEVVSYVHDRVQQGGSERRQIESKWQRVVREILLLDRDLVSRLLSFQIHVWTRPHGLQKFSPANLASEFADFLKARLDSVNRVTTFQRCNRRNPDKAFADYGLLREHFESIDLHPDKGYRAPWTLNDFAAIASVVWICNPAQMIGIVPTKVLSLIQEKSKRRVTYAPTEACWLLIIATGETLADQGGPVVVVRELGQETLVEAACASGFEKVYFLERPHRWLFDLTVNRLIAGKRG